MPTNISWSEETWNPTTGCDSVSEGCRFCYAREQAARMQRFGNKAYQNVGYDRMTDAITPGFKLTMHPDRLEIPTRWRKPRLVFVDSMSDLFHPDVTDDFIAQVFGVMIATRRHKYQVLTKRPRRMRDLLSHDGFCVKALSWAGTYAKGPVELRAPWPNIWLGTSVEDQKAANLRVPLLVETPAAIRFLSCEPLLAPVTLERWLPPDVCDDDSDGVHHVGCGCVEETPALDWIISGAESGPHRRPFDIAWVRQLRDEAEAAGVAYFFKQGSALQPGKNRELDGRTYDEMPA